MQSQRPTIIHSANPARSDTHWFMKQMKGISTQMPQSTTFFGDINLNSQPQANLHAMEQIFNTTICKTDTWIETINHQTPSWYFNHKQVYIIMGRLSTQLSARQPLELHPSEAKQHLLSILSRLYLQHNMKNITACEHLRQMWRHKQHTHI